MRDPARDPYRDMPRERPRESPREFPAEFPREFSGEPPRDPSRDFPREPRQPQPETRDWPQQSRGQHRPPEPAVDGPPRSRRRETEPAESPVPAKPKSGRSATFSVLLMTGVSLVAVAALAVQASGQTSPLGNAGSSQAGPGPGVPVPTGTATGVPVNPLALPANSGSGLRIVYSPAARRVWLVAADGSTVEHTFPIVPGTIPVPAGNYHVSNRNSGENGSDGISVQYVVFFDNPATAASTAFAFDAEADVSGLPPAPTGHTAAVRMAQADAGAIWYFAPVGTLVVVV